MSKMKKSACLLLEHFETPRWAADSILAAEKLTKTVLDPCCGTGVLGEAAKAQGYSVYSSDILDWGYGNPEADFLDESFFFPQGEFSVFMNPPFSKACRFVKKCFEAKAEKIISFQTLAWYESSARREFWDQYPPKKIYLCGDRATCWRHDLPKDEKGNRYNPETGKRLSGTSTAHAWFVFEKGFSGVPELHRLYKKA